MTPITSAIVIGGSVLLGISMLLLVHTVHRGRELCRRFASRRPKDYAESGSPRPGYFAGPRRHAFVRFVLQRNYEHLPDRDLVEEFGRLRRIEVIKLGFVLAGFATIGAAYVWVNWF